MTIKNINPTIAKPNMNGIQRGEVTHHQDQSIFPVNLRTKNTMKRTADKLKPVPELLFDVISILYFSLYQFCLIKFHIIDIFTNIKKIYTLWKIF